MEKIIDREVAWRIFAHEFVRSNLYFSEGDERAPNYIITPTGVKCNRLFIVGVVTEVENIGHENNLWKARIADPTGVFTIYAGQYQPEAAIFLSELEVPAFVALVGKARKYEPEDGNVYLSIRPEEINLADGKLRDRWVLDTAQRTLERIKDVEEAQASGLSGNELVEFLQNKGSNAVFSDGIVRALSHYDNMEQIISELKTAITNAIQVVVPDASGSAEAVSPEPQMEEPRVAPLEGASTYAPAGGDMSIPENGHDVDEHGLQEQPDDKPQINADEPGFMEDILDKPELKTADEVVEENIPETELPTETDIIEKEEVREEVPDEPEQVIDEINDVVKEPEIASEPDTEDINDQETAPEPKEQIAAILDNLDSGDGVPHSMIVETALESGMNATIVESGIKELMAEGRCYEPKIGKLRKV